MFLMNGDQGDHAHGRHSDRSHRVMDRKVQVKKKVQEVVSGPASGTHIYIHIESVCACLFFSLSFYWAFIGLFLHSLTLIFLFF